MKASVAVTFLGFRLLYATPSQEDHEKASKNPNYFVHVILSGIVKDMIFPGPPNFVSAENLPPSGGSSSNTRPLRAGFPDGGRMKKERVTVMKKSDQFNESQFLFYQTEDGRQRVEVCLEGGTVWLTQKLMAELFQTTPQNIGMHLKNIFSEGEMSLGSVSKDSLLTAADGKKYRTQLYRLEVYREFFRA
jgi:hypothetical protein